MPRPTLAAHLAAAMNRVGRRLTPEEREAAEAEYYATQPEEMKMKTYDIFRAENRANGYEDHVGRIEAPTEADALAEARATIECDATHHLYAAESVADDDQPE
jgi:flavin reductase (DIM6/NTAB) family NADH-FMN oxidoreductase RutF